MTRIPALLTFLVLAIPAWNARAQFPVNQNAPPSFGLERAKRDVLFQFFTYKVEDEELARALTGQFFEERIKVIRALHERLPREQVAAQVQNAHIVNEGSSSITLPDRKVIWLFQNGCQITTETVQSTGDRLTIALIGLGNQEVIGDPAVLEKRLDLMMMELPPFQQVTLTTSSFSPLVKGIIIVGAGLLLEGCSQPAPPPQCRLTPGGCPSPADCAISIPTCTPIRPRVRVTKCECM